MLNTASAVQVWKVVCDVQRPVKLNSWRTLRSAHMAVAQQRTQRSVACVFLYIYIYICMHIHKYYVPESTSVFALLLFLSRIRMRNARQPSCNMTSYTHNSTCATHSAVLTSSFLPTSKTHEEGDGIDVGKHGKTGTPAGAVNFPLASRPLAL